MPTDPNKPAFNVDEFCEVYSIGRSYLYEAIRSKAIKVRKAGRRTLILKSEADAWLASLPVGGPEDTWDFADELEKANAKYNSLSDFNKHSA